MAVPRKLMDAAEHKRLVATGYDRIADVYAQWSIATADPPQQAMIARAIERHPLGGRLVDLGCGTGEHTTAALSPHFDVLGVDISPVSIELARDRVPGVEFVVSDMATLELPGGSVDVVTAFFSLIHLPRTEHDFLLRKIASWLREGGTMIVTMGATELEGAEDDWLGTTMAWSHWDAATNERLVVEAGFTIIDTFETLEDEHDPDVGRHFWVVAELAGH